MNYSFIQSDVERILWYYGFLHSDMKDIRNYFKQMNQQLWRQDCEWPAGCKEMKLRREQLQGNIIGDELRELLGIELLRNLSAIVYLLVGLRWQVFPEFESKSGMIC